LEKLLKRKKKKLYIFSICLISSFIIWILIKLSGSYVVSIEKNLEFVNKNPKYEFIEKPTEKIKLIVKASGYKLIKEIFNSNINVTINLKNVKINSNVNGTLFELIPINEYSNSISFQLTNGISFIKAQPEIIKIEFAKKIKKEVPIIPAYNITTERQFMIIGNVITKPKFAIIEGPEKIINQIEYITNDSLIALNCKNSFVKNKLLKNPYFNSNVKITPDSIKIICNIEEYTEITLNVPISFIQYKSLFKIKTYPDKVSLKFRIPLNKYKDIKPEMFTIIPDTNEFSSEHILLKLTKKPPFIKNIRISPESAEYILISL